VLNSWPAHQALQLSTFIYTIVGHPQTPSAGPYPTNRRGELQEALSTAWAWLEGQALLIRDPRYGEGVVKLSSRARKLAQEQPVKSKGDTMTDAHGSTRGDRWYGKTARDSSADQALPPNRKVFVVHGHAGVEHAVVGFLRKVGLEPIILHEQPNEGRTIIEKFEAHSDVGFAVVLFTPDDVGGFKDGPQRPRARQNVILELGYFVGRLGRKNVCPLIQGEVELPSDVLGVAWVALDAHDGWHKKLANELRAAGYEFDFNKVLA
jgi:hypothetical protein